ncbi:DNA (cytosine-5)-methyltransferase 3B-like isoform X2 [Hippocampus comes]|uniref:DNA (cytosine-5)-methyltransferase 3B-like isoform X2 n=1 Tax=Hippocampus comes TaxID=109280 RepID=UPI00094E3401|nr:PREDICTED: DNA (cytosine-5)-methyltransferase 3B-like isoform X2 [Hippocampus comes]
MGAQRKSYPAEFKLQVVKYAVENSNRAAGRKFGVSETGVRAWRKAKVTLLAMKKTRKANRGQKARWPQLEERVHRWALEQRAAGRGLSTTKLRLHALVVAKEMNVSDFAGGPSWCYRFMQRNRLFIRAQKPVGQKQPADFQGKTDSFREIGTTMKNKMTKQVIVSPDSIPDETDGLNSLTWLNTLLKTKFQEMQHISSGACHCQIMDCVIPGSIDMSKVKFDAQAEYDCKHNFSLLQEAFTKNHITRSIPSDELIRGDFKINLEFLLWFKAFYTANVTDEEYDAVNARNNRDISLYLPSKCPTKSSRRLDSAALDCEVKKDEPMNNIKCETPGIADDESLFDSECSIESNGERMSDSPDKQTIPQVNTVNEQNEVYMRYLKPCHVALTKLKDLNIHDSPLGENGDSGKRAEKTSPRHKAHKGRRKANYQDGKGFLTGELVWGKVEGFAWWPGLVIPWKTKFSPQGLRRVEWFGDGTFSKIHTEALLPFRDFTECFCKNSFASVATYKVAIFQVIELASERCEKSFEEAKDDKEKELNLMVDWAVKGFLPTGPQGFAPSVVQDAVQMSNSDSAHSDYQPPVKRKHAFKSRASTSNYIFTRDILIERLKDKGTKIKDCCLACGSADIVVQHPLFEGGLCFKCKENFIETLYRYDEDGYQSYCTVCCGGTEVILCGNASCCRCFCKDCVEILVGRGTFRVLKDVDPWSCYICQPAQCEGNLKLRPDWSVRVQDLFANNSAMEFEPHRVYPAISADRRKPLKVLSLFDGIATGYLVLKDLGLKVERYIASEICEDSIAVGMIKHVGKIEYVKDVRTITRKHLAEWGPFDLLIGGSPCNDLSMVNPLRKGLFEGTGRLFFEFYRILTLLKPKEGDDRPFFWLFENVVFMSTRDKTDICRFLECNPIIIDAVTVSPAHRARYFWGNLPGMNRPLTASLDQKLNLQDCLEVGRVAKLDKVRTITTKSNSMIQGKLGLPVIMNGKEDYLWCTEMEQIFGFPKHYTDVNNMGRMQRQRVLGRSWSVAVIRHLMAPLKDYFECESHQSGP